MAFKAPGKPRVKIAWAVNAHKIITAFIILGLMAAYDNFSPPAWVYLALHGTYGYCWLIKDLGFRDHLLEEKTSIFGAVMLYVGLIGWYWVIPWLFIARHLAPSGFDLFFAITLHSLGVVTMIASDCQRHFSLKYHPGLITGGMYRYTRNPNYLGETMLYSAYAYLADHWLAWAIVAYAVFGTFLPRMYRKDHAISRHPGWEGYYARTGLLIPWALLNGRAFIDLFRERQNPGSRPASDVAGRP
ncbi:MAG: DUF1295 domain-containing protein [Pseudomonadota bacterium]